MTKHPHTFTEGSVAPETPAALTRGPRGQIHAGSVGMATVSIRAEVRSCGNNGMKVTGIPNKTLETKVYSTLNNLLFVVVWSLSILNMPLLILPLQIGQHWP